MNKQQLFFLHFAGGNRYSYQFLAPELNDFEVIVLELPGRGKRNDEPLIKDFMTAADDIYEQMIARITSPNFAIYGHSMGATLALMVVLMLERSGYSPLCLFVSGNAGPGIANHVKRYQLGHEAFVKELKKIGGVPDGFLEDEELFHFFEPILRADFEISENNTLSKEHVVNIPIIAIMGNTEPYAANITNWNNHTTSAFAKYILDGNHFFIHKHPKKMGELIRINYIKRLHLRLAQKS